DVHCWHVQQLAGYGPLHCSSVSDVGRRDAFVRQTIRARDALRGCCGKNATCFVCAEVTEGLTLLLVCTSMLPYSQAIIVGCCCHSLNASSLRFSSLLTHQRRDATRRGMWFWPVGSSEPLYYPLYVVAIMLLPVIIGPRLEEIEDDWSSGDESSDDESDEQM